MREILKQRGIDVQRTACISADDDYLHGYAFWLVLPTGEAIECAIAVPGDEATSSTTVDWHPLPTVFNAGVTAGRQLLEKEQNKADRKRRRDEGVR